MSARRRLRQRRVLRHLPVLRRVALPAVILLLGTFTTAPAHAAISTASATHAYFLTSVSPFTQRTFSDTSSGLFTYDLTKSTGTGDITTAGQNVQVTANTIAAQLAANTQGSTAIARATLDLRFTLTDPAQLSLTGNAQGPGQDFSGGYSLSLRRITDPGNTFLLTTSGFTAANWASLLATPLPLTPGSYDLRMVASISGGAVGSTTNHALLQLAGNAALAGDYNDSGSVEQGDLDLVLNNWGQPRGTWQNANGFTSAAVDQEELDRVLNHWGSSNAPTLQSGLPGALPGAFPGAVPEPASALLSLAGLTTLRRHPRPRKEPRNRSRGLAAPSPLAGPARLARPPVTTDEHG